MSSLIYTVLFAIFVIGRDSSEKGVDPLEAYMANVGDLMDSGKKLLLKQQLHHLNTVRNTQSVTHVHVFRRTDVTYEVVNQSSKSVIFRGK